MAYKMSRRDLLKGIGAAALAVPLLNACQPKEQPAEKPAATTKVEEEKPTPVAKEKPTLRLTLWAEQSGEGRTWPQDRGLKWAEDTGIADVDVELVSYNEMPMKQLTAVAAGTLWDVMFNNNKIGPYNAYKGVYLYLDELIAANDTDMTDYFPAAVVGITFKECCQAWLESALVAGLMFPVTGVLLLSAARVKIGNSTCREMSDKRGPRIVPGCIIGAIRP